MSSAFSTPCACLCAERLCRLAANSQLRTMQQATPHGVLAQAWSKAVVHDSAHEEPLSIIHAGGCKALVVAL